jgi:hypothetical protein
MQYPVTQSELGQVQSRRMYGDDCLYESLSAMSRDTGMCHRMDASGISHSH